MNEETCFRAYVEKLLKEIWEQQDITADSDGDYPSRYDSAAVWVRIEPGEPMAVRVFAHAAHGVKKSAKLLAELNEVTSRSRFTRLVWSGGLIAVDYCLPATAVDAGTLAGAYHVVGSQAAEIGGMVAAVYGGATPFDADTGEKRPIDGEAA